MMGDNKGDAGDDGGLMLWTVLKKTLLKDEYDLKRRICVLDMGVKVGEPFTSWLRTMANYENRTDTNDLPTWSESGLDLEPDNYPWNGCKFAAVAIAHLLADWTVCDLDAMRSTIAPLCHNSLGDIARVVSTSTTVSITDAFLAACRAAEEFGHSTALHVNVRDMDLIRRQERSPFKQFKNTFAHAFVMTVSPAGVFLYQAYGPDGYTLRYHAEHGRHGTGPMSAHDEAVTWIDRFNEFAAAPCGKWTADINAAYAHCFEVDLIALGAMRCGHKLDAHVSVQSQPFNAKQVAATFRLLTRLSPPPPPSPEAARVTQEGDLRKKLKEKIRGKAKGRQGRGPW